MRAILCTIAIILGLVLISAGCTRPSKGPEPLVTPAAAATTPAVTTPQAGLANPAAVFCTSKNHGYEIRKNPDGSEYGVCILPGGTECDEWEFYLGLCPATGSPGAATSSDTPPNPPAAFCLSRNYTYETRGNPDGSEYGACVFPDGKECEAQAFFRGECTEATAT